MESTGKPGWLAGAITGIAMSGVINFVILGHMLCVVWLCNWNYRLVFSYPLEIICNKYPP